MEPTITFGARAFTRKIDEFNEKINSLFEKIAEKENEIQFRKTNTKSKLKSKLEQLNQSFKEETQKIHDIISSLLNDKERLVESLKELSDEFIQVNKPIKQLQLPAPEPVDFSYKTNQKLALEKEKIEKTIKSEFAILTQQLEEDHKQNMELLKVFYEKEFEKLKEQPIQISRKSVSADIIEIELSFKYESVQKQNKSRLEKERATFQTQMEDLRRELAEEVEVIKSEYRRKLAEEEVRVRREMGRVSAVTQPEIPDYVSLYALTPEIKAKIKAEVEESFQTEFQNDLKELIACIHSKQESIRSKLDAEYRQEYDAQSTVNLVKKSNLAKEIFELKNSVQKKQKEVENLKQCWDSTNHDRHTNREALKEEKKNIAACTRKLQKLSLLHDDLKAEFVLHVPEERQFIISQLAEVAATLEEEEKAHSLDIQKNDQIHVEEVKSIDHKVKKRIEQLDDKIKELKAYVDRMNVAAANLENEYQRYFADVN